MSKRKFVDADVFSAMTSTAAPIPTVQNNMASTPFRQAEPSAPRRSTESGLPSGMIRATIIAPIALLEKCRDIAYWERLRDQDVYAEALSAFIAQYEKQAGRPVEPRPGHARRTKN